MYLLIANISDWGQISIRQVSDMVKDSMLCSRTHFLQAETCTGTAHDVVVTLKYQNFVFVFSRVRPIDDGTENI